MRARVGFVTQWYDPERGAAAVPGTISRSLRARGHDVDVITGFPNYPSGAIHSGYRLAPYAREMRDGITVHRAPLFPSHDARPLRRAANYLSFAASASALAPACLGKADVVLVHSSPATAAIPALVLGAIRRKPYVLHIQDLWPQTVTSSGLLGGHGSRRVERPLQGFCDLTYRRAKSIAVTSPGMAELVASRGVDEEKIFFVPNWTDESAFRPEQRSAALAAELGLTRDFTVMYAGNFGEFQALDVVVEAANMLRSDVGIGFALVGGGVEEPRLRSLVEKYRLDNVAFVPPQPFERMAAVLALGDVQVVSLLDLPLFRTTTPSKLQGVLAAGRPVIGAVTGDAAEVVQRSGAGPVVRPGSASELANAITEAKTSQPAELRRRGQAGRAHYLAHFSERVAADRLSELLERAAQHGRNGHG